LLLLISSPALVSQRKEAVIIIRPPALGGTKIKVQSRYVINSSYYHSRAKIPEGICSVTTTQRHFLPEECQESNAKTYRQIVRAESQIIVRVVSILV
jgi:hypothetical protein